MMKSRRQMINDAIYYTSQEEAEIRTILSNQANESDYQQAIKLLDNRDLDLDYFSRGPGVKHTYCIVTEIEKRFPAESNLFGAMCEVDMPLNERAMRSPHVVACATYIGFSLSLTPEEIREVLMDKYYGTHPEQIMNGLVKLSIIGLKEWRKSRESGPGTQTILQALEIATLAPENESPKQSKRRANYYGNER